MVSIILVNYNGAGFLRKCLNSITEQARDIEYEIILVDNASTDESQQIIKPEYPTVKLIESNENLGFSRGNNLGAQYAVGEYLLFLNTDTYLIENSIRILSQYLSSHANVAVVGSRLLFEDRSFQLSAGHLPNVLVECGDKIRHGFDQMFHALSSGLNSSLFSKAKEVGWVTGACMMVRKDVFGEVGGFDENIFMYFEDKDLCKRIADLGWKVMYCPTTSVVHLLGGSSSSREKEAGSEHYRASQVYYYRKHLGSFQSFLVASYLRLAGKI